MTPKLLILEVYFMKKTVDVCATKKKKKKKKKKAYVHSDINSIYRVDGSVYLFSNTKDNCVFYEHVKFEASL